MSKIELRNGPQYFNQIIVIFLFVPLTYWDCFQVATFPFSDHNCPPIQLIASFCQSAYSWLKEDIQNVVVVHCKAGMGRTGLMICSLLLFLKASHDNQLQRLWNVSCALFSLWVLQFLTVNIILQFFPTAEEAIDYFNHKRCVDGKALVLPSQIVSH